MGNITFCQRKSRKEQLQQCKHDKLINVITNIVLEKQTKEDQVKQKQFKMLKNDTYEDLKDEISNIFMLQDPTQTILKIYYVGKNILDKTEWEEVKYSSKINQLANTLCVVSHVSEDNITDQNQEQNKIPIVIGITGPSGSYKTQISEALQFQYQAEYICLNKFYDSFKQDSEAIENKDDPDCYQWEYLENVIQEKIQNSKFNYIIVEGFCLFQKQNIRALFDKMIYLELDEDEMYKRRMKVNRIAEFKYRELVIPEHRRYLNMLKQNNSEFKIKFIDASMYFDLTLQMVKDYLFEKNENY